MLAAYEIKKSVPKWIIDRTQKNMDKYNLGLYDAFEEAVKNYPGLKKGSKLWEAWYYSEFAAYIPGAYIDPKQAQLEEVANKVHRAGAFMLVTFEEETEDPCAMHTAGLYYSKRGIQTETEWGYKVSDIIPFLLTGETKKARQEELRQLAINFSNYTGPDLDLDELTVISDFFEENGRKYGLLGEFRKNGIC